jgi:3-oxoacyl-[acyl-carrier protein] reductase
VGPGQDRADWRAAAASGRMAAGRAGRRGDRREGLAAEVRKHDVRVTTLLPSTVNTEMAASVGLTIGPAERMRQPEDVAELVLATLRLPARVFVRDVALLTTTPV